MSAWVYRTNGSVSDPVSFRELAAMVRSGDLGPTDQVRRTEDAHWELVESVVGLMRLAQQGVPSVEAVREQARRAGEERVRHREHLASEKAAAVAVVAAAHEEQQRKLGFLLTKVLPILLGAAAIIFTAISLNHDPMQSKNFESEDEVAPMTLPLGNSSAD